jgi:predicted transcriptional regulator of viral defense system
MNATAFYRKLGDRGRITTREASQITGLTIPAASMALRRLAADGLVIPLTKGHWYLGDSGSKPGALVTAAAGPYPAYLSGWSALRLHGRIQQIPQRLFAVTLGRPGEVTIAGTEIALHRIKPELFSGYEYDTQADGFVASPEKALFDLAYLAAMNRSRVVAHLPETELSRLKWKETECWLRRIPARSQRLAVAKNLRQMREQQAMTAA